MNEKNYEAIIEAILFTMGESVELDKIAAAIELDKKETKAIIEKMMKHYENPSIGVKIIELDDAYQMCTCLLYTSTGYHNFRYPVCRSVCNNADGYGGRRVHRESFPEGVGQG